MYDICAPEIASVCDKLASLKYNSVSLLIPAFSPKSKHAHNPASSSGKILYILFIKPLLKSFMNLLKILTLSLPNIFISSFLVLTVPQIF